MDMEAKDKACIATSNTKLAACMMVLGAQLRKHLPLIWNDTHQSKADYMAGRNPTASVTFNFDDVPESTKEAINFFQDEKAEEKFEGTVRAICEPLGEAAIKEIMKAHAGSTVRNCRETLDAREFLVQLIKHFPDDAKYDLIKGHGGSFAQIGKNSSNKLRSELLNKID